MWCSNSLIKCTKSVTTWNSRRRKSKFRRLVSSIVGDYSICSCRLCTISHSIRGANTLQTSSSRGLSKSGYTGSMVSGWHNI